MTFSRFSKLYFEDDSFTDSYHGELWHYTNTNGFMGIVGRNSNQLKFWFTRSDCMNDESEGKDILSVLNEACRELLMSGAINREFYEIASDRSITKIHYFSFPFSEENKGNGELRQGTMLSAGECEAYICCFSKSEDQLEMWRYYSKTGDGCCLGVWHECLFYEQSQYEFSEVINDKMKIIPIKGISVIYSKEEKMSFLKDRLLKAYDAYEQEKREQGCEKAKELLNGYLDNLMRENQFRFKHECFVSEQEYRYVVYRPMVKPKYSKNELPEIQYRISNGTIAPYIEIKCSKDALWGVQLSPFVKQDYALDTIRSYVSSCGLQNIKVEKSTLPVRF